MTIEENGTDSDWKEYFDLVCNYEVMQALVRVDGLIGCTHTHQLWEIKFRCKSLDTSEHAYSLDAIFPADSLEHCDSILADIEIGEHYLVKGQYSIDILKPELTIFNIRDYQFPDYDDVNGWEKLYDLICTDSYMWSVVIVESHPDYIKVESGWEIIVHCRTFDARGHFYNIDVTFNTHTSDEAIKIMADMKVGSIHLVKGRYAIDAKKSRISISHAVYHNHNLILESLRKAFHSSNNG